MLFKDCLCLQVGRVARKMSKITRQKLASYGLTTTQFFLLTALYEEDGVPISVLAPKVALDKATLTGLLDRLERAGFTRRHPDPSDRRKVVVTLDDAAAAERVAPEYADHGERLRSVLAGRGQDELEVIAAFFDDLLAGDDQSPDPGARRSRR